MEFVRPEVFELGNEPEIQIMAVLWKSDSAKNVFDLYHIRTNRSDIKNSLGPFSLVQDILFRITVEYNIFLFTFLSQLGK